MDIPQLFNLIRKKAVKMALLKCKKVCKPIVYKPLMCPELDSNQHTLAGAAT